ncbi:hypothetical protein E4U15_001885 [Claviceps sp. LM218 group G6]|nr:hypothetical protein E4U15_001885 [Claviceps sp. LM218 group G6]
MREFIGKPVWPKDNDGLWKAPDELVSRMHTALNSQSQRDIGSRVPGDSGAGTGNSYRTEIVPGRRGDLTAY